GRVPEGRIGVRGGGVAGAGGLGGADRLLGGEGVTCRPLPAAVPATNLPHPRHHPRGDPMRAALLCTAVLFAACSSAENDGMADDTTNAAMAPAALSAADVEGSWDLEVRRMDSDSVILTGTMTMAPGSNVFTQIIGEGEARTVSITFDGDSMMTSVEPYPSDVREGMMVATTG